MQYNSLTGVPNLTSVEPNKGCFQLAVNITRSTTAAEEAGGVSITIIRHRMLELSCRVMQAQTPIGALEFPAYWFQALAPVIFSRRPHPYSLRAWNRSDPNLNETVPNVTN